MSNNNEPVVVLSTAADAAEGNKIASQLVQEKLAACVLVQAGTTSHYVWEGKATTAAEVTLLIKTTRGHVPSLETRLQALHSYQVPAFLVLPVIALSPAYGAWLQDALSRHQQAE